MKTIIQIRNELKDIRHYYVNKKDIERVTTLIGRPESLNMVESYNRYIKQAPIKIFNLYISLYVNNNSQETVAMDWGCSTGYIKTLNKKLYEFFVEKFKKEEDADVQ